MRVAPVRKRAMAACLLAAGGLVAGPPASAALQIERAGRGYEVTVEDGTPLEEALAELGAFGGFPVEVVGEPVTLGAQAFGARDVAAALRRLGRGQIMVIWHGQRDAAGSTVRRVRVLARNPDTQRAAPRAAGQQEPGLDGDDGQPPGQSGLDLENLADLPMDERVMIVADLAGVEDRSSTVADLEQIARTDPAPEVRATAVRVLAGVGNGVAWAAVERGLRDDDAMVRSAALVELSNSDESFPYESVRDVADGDPDPEVRKLARTVLSSHDAQ